MVQYSVQDWSLLKSAWFRRPTDEFGAFSNMAKSYPLRVQSFTIGSSEHLYQAMRYTHEPEIQQYVLKAKSPMAAKKISRDWNEFTRSDWMDIRVDVMRWALHVKLANHWERFGCLLRSTGNRPIVEWSRHDNFWGAGPVTDDVNRGQNVLGRLLTELRESFLEDPQTLRKFPQPLVPDSKLAGGRI